MPNEPENTSVSGKPCPLRYQSSNATTSTERNSSNSFVTPSNIVDDPLNPTRSIIQNSGQEQNSSLDTKGELPGYLLEDLKPMTRTEIDFRTDNWFVMSSVFNSLSPQSMLYVAHVRIPSVHNQILVDSSQATFSNDDERDEWISLHTFCIVEDQEMFNMSNSRVAGTVCKIQFQDPNGQYAVIKSLSDGSPNPLPDVSEFTSAREYDVAYGETVRTLAEIQADEYSDYLEEECRDTDGNIAGTDDKAISNLYHSMDDFFPGFSGLPVQSDFVVSSPSCRRDRNNGNFHSGFDLATPIGNQILSPAPGIVEVEDNVNDSSAGKLVAIYHDRPNDSGKKLYTRYLHMNTVTVRKGQRVVTGQQIGTTGNTDGGTEISTGPHLHYEIKINGIFGFGGTIVPAFRDSMEPMITAPFIV